MKETEFASVYHRIVGRRPGPMGADLLSRRLEGLSPQLWEEYLAERHAEGQSMKLAYCVEGFLAYAELFKQLGAGPVVPVNTSPRAPRPVWDYDEEGRLIPTDDSPHAK